MPVRVGIGLFIGIFIGSALIGIAIGLLAALIFKSRYFHPAASASGGEVRKDLLWMQAGRLHVRVRT